MIEAAKAKELMLATAESCTGGLVAGALTGVAGSSAVVDRGFVTYSNEAKNKLVKVPSKTIMKFGAVSDEVAIAMAQGGLHKAGADISVSITGVAGPGGGTQQKPVGLVHFGIATNWSDAQPNRMIFSGTRDEIRYQSVEHALKMVYREVMDLP